MKKKKTLIIVLLIVAVAAGGIAFAVHKITSAVPSIQAQPAAYGEIRAYVSGSGIVVPDNKETYIAPASVKVSAVNFEEGDTVKAGDVIASFDVEDLNRQLRSNALTLEIARQSLAQTLRENEEMRQEIIDNDKERTRLLLELDFFDKDDPDEAEDYQDYKLEAETLKQKNETLDKSIVPEEALQQLRNKVELEQISYNNTSKMVNEGKADIVAQAGGIITNLSLVKGMYTPAAPSIAFIIEENENVRVSMALSKYDLQKAREGQSATVKFGTDQFDGKLTKIESKANADGTVNGEITVENPTEILRLGIEVKIEILTYENERALCLPVEAVKVDAGGDYCYRLNPMDQGFYKPEKVYVQVGNSSEMIIEILEGLSEGDLVALGAPNNMEMMPLYSAQLPEDESGESSGTDSGASK